MPPPPPPPPPPPAPHELSWRERLDIVDSLMRDVSRQEDAHKLVQLYSKGVRKLSTIDTLIAVSRRDLERPWYRITRFSGWPEDHNPWTSRDKLPRFDHGFFGDLLYADKPAVLESFSIPPSDPAAPYLEGMKCLFAMPQYENGTALNMSILAWRDPGAFRHNELANTLWQSNLFGRTTANLVLRAELTKAYRALDRELAIVGQIQHSLLPQELPKIPGLELAALYEPSAHAGGDSYDVFTLPDGRYGLLIADASGHGTPAAVIMAVMHALARAYSGPPDHPCQFLDHLNERLLASYTSINGSFVTAFYGVYDPRERTLKYACAGHPPPRLLTKRGMVVLDAVGGLPLGIMPTQECSEATVTLEPGDLLAMYTDGITEAQNPDNDLFDVPRLDAILREHSGSLHTLAETISARVCSFTGMGELPPSDDRTLLLARAT
jgi:phosphoserine phosphatase RsbU/P